MFENIKYTRLQDAGHGTEENVSDGNAFSFDSAFKYDSGPSASKYNSRANYNSAFKYSGNAINHGRHEHGQVKVDMSNGTNGAYMEEGYERNRPSIGLFLTTWVLTILSYIFFVFTSPIT
jgi:hypothetical protein